MEEIYSLESLISNKLKEYELEIQELRLAHNQELEDLRIRYDLKTLNTDKEDDRRIF